jgi:hypothetical protein
MDRERLIWIDEGANGSIHSCQKQDCELTRVTHGTSEASWSCLAVREGIAYFSKYDQGEGVHFWSLDLSDRDAQASRIHDEPIEHGCVSLTVDDDSLYWVDSHETVFARPRVDGGAVRIVAYAPVDFAWQFLEHGEHLYWSGLNHTAPVVRVRKDGTVAPEILVSDQASGIAFDATRLYWIGGSGSSLSSCELSDCAHTTQVLATGISGAFGLQISGEVLYWLEGSPYSDSFFGLRSCSRDGCPEGASVAVPKKVRAFVVDEVSIYAAVRATGGYNWPSRIQVFPR